MNKFKSEGQQINEGLRLAKGPWRSLCGELAEEDEYRAALTAILLENSHDFYNNKLTEDTKIANVGVFDKFAMPIIRAVFPNLIATDIVSVQPMDGPVSLVFFLETRYAVTKGSAKAGQTNLSALTGHNSQYQYTSETVDTEAIGTGNGSTTAFTASVAWVPVRPASFSIVAGSVTGADNGDGSISGSGIASGSINYQTGAVSITFSSAPGNGVELDVTYEYNSEGNDKIPQLDLMLTHAPVQAKPHKLRARWSVEAATDLKAVHGLDAEQELMAHLAEELRYEIDRSIIQDLYRIADATSVAAWDATPPANIPYFTHQLTFINTLVTASNVVFKKTKRAAANWMVCGIGVANIIEALPQFKPTNIDGAGVVHMGTLNGRWQVYKDPYLPDYDSILGYRGTSFADAGYVYAPYVPLYRTPTVYLDDFMGKAGLMSRYGKKLVNPDFFVRVSVTP